MQTMPKSLIPSGPERSSSSTTAGDRRERISNRSLQSVYENEKEELINRNYGANPRCSDRGIQLTFNNGMDVMLKWRDRNQYRSNIDMRANEIQSLEGWKNLSDQMDLEKMLFILVRYIRLQLGDEQDVITLVLEVLAPPLKEEKSNMILLRADDVLEEGCALLFVLDYLRMKFPTRRQETMDCNRWKTKRTPAWKSDWHSNSKNEGRKIFLARNLGYQQSKNCFAYLGYFKESPPNRFAEKMVLEY